MRRSLQPLWDTDFEGNTLCMVAEPTVDRRRLGKIGLAGRPYYNAGVLFVDLDAWRTTDAEHRLLDCIEREGTHLFANDQDAINIALAAEIKQISPAYNYANTFDLYPYRFLAKLVPAWVDRETFDAARRDPARSPRSGCASSRRSSPCSYAIGSASDRGMSRAPNAPSR